MLRMYSVHRNMKYQLHIDIFITFFFFGIEDWYAHKKWYMYAHVHCFLLEQVWVLLKGNFLVVHWRHAPFKAVLRRQVYKTFFLSTIPKLHDREMLSYLIFFLRQHCRQLGNIFRTAIFPRVTFCLFVF